MIHAMVTVSSVSGPPFMGALWREGSFSLNGPDRPLNH